MEAWLIWIIVAAVLVIVELLTQMVWTLCLAVGCVAAAVCDFCGVPVVWQAVVAAAGSVAAFFVLAPRLRRWQHRSERRDGRDTRTGMDALLGRRGNVTQEIAPGRLGRVRIDGDNWQARCGGDEVVRRGETVVVEAYDSIILTVSPIHNA